MVIKDIKLKVSEAVQDDVGKGIVRMDTSSMKEIDSRPGDVVLIKGESGETVAIVDRAYPADVGLGIIRMDGLTRWNCKSSIGEGVSVTKAVVKKATTVKLAPTQRGFHINVHPDTIRKALLGRAMIKGDVISLGGTRTRRNTMSGSPFEDIFRMIEEDFFSFGMHEMKFQVVNTGPRGPIMVSNTSKIEMLREPVQLAKEGLPEISYEDIGGLDDEIKKIREMVEIPMKHPELFKTLGIDPPKGVLLFGPPGTGKTLLAKAVASESDAHFITINGPEVMSKWVGEAEKRIREVFDEMDGMKGRGKVVVIAATNRQNALDPALRRPGRFDREIEIGVPDKKGRLDILKIHTRNMPLTDNVKLEKLSEITHGFVGADLEALAKEAAMSVLRKVLPQVKLKESEPVSSEILDKIRVDMDDFKEGLKNVRPSAMREVLIEVPNVKWSDVGGLEKVKQELKEAIEWPLKHPGSFKRMGISPPKGVLLYGPPGCGKTLLARAVATESNSNFISVKGPEMLSKWVGESEKAVREIFRKARQVAPCIVFFDEIDAIAPRRGASDGSRVTEQVVNQILTELDGLEELTDVTILAATNRPDIVDSAMLRPGRFDRLILTPPPDEEARLQIFKVHTKKMPLTKNVDLGELVDHTKNYSGADIQAVCREAAILALRKDMKAKEVNMDHFKKAMKVVGPSLRGKDFDKYQGFIERARERVTKIPEKDINYLG
jgi:transitional endoplasmic reticulum ATPase